MSHVSMTPTTPPLDVEAHRGLVEALARTLPPRALPLLTEDGPDAPGCLGCVLAEPVTARLAVPPFTNSAMDGFAVRHSDIADVVDGHTVTLPVGGDIPAGDTTAHAVAPGTAWRIMTGAPMPAGADTVVKVEQTDHAPGIRKAPATVTFLAPTPAGANVRHRGEDVEPGAPILPAGTVLDGPALAAAASVGHGTLSVHPRPRVGIVTTGTELVDPGSDLRPGQIPDSNSLLLRGLVSDAGGNLVAHARTCDDPRVLRDELEAWPAVDLVLTAGGISAGAYEVVRQALSGPAMRFHHVAQQPGGPQGVGTIELAGRTVPVLCLPGNPVSVFVSFHVHAAGLIAVLAGRARDTRPLTVAATTGAGWSSPRAKVQFIPLRVDFDGRVVPIHPLGSKSHLVASLPAADGLGIVPVGVDHVEAGQPIDVIPTRMATRALRHDPRTPPTEETR